MYKRLSVFLRFLCIVFSFLCLITPVSASSKRVALVVGNSNYLHSTTLTNPKNDAEDLSKALDAADFKVIMALDKDLLELSTTLDYFYKEVQGAETALIFYAGHGMQFQGVNYLIPIDAKLRSPTRFKQETIALQDIIQAVERRAKITLVFLDACRDNPIADDLKRKFLGKSRSAVVSRGFAPMQLRNSDTLIVFAAAPNRTASDGSGRNSPFTKALLNNIHSPGVEIELMMKRVTNQVYQETKGEQTPERLSRLTSEFVFMQKKAGLLDVFRSTKTDDENGKAAPHKSTIAKKVEIKEKTNDPCSGDNPPISCIWRK